MLRKSGETAKKATTILDSQSVAFKNELLFQNGINIETGLISPLLPVNSTYALRDRNYCLVERLSLSLPFG
jgi:hypothetical protein